MSEEKKSSLTVVPAPLKVYQQLDVPPRVLLGPGPSNAHPRVLQALSMRQVGHLDPRFIGLMNDVQELLRYAFQTQNQVTIPVSGCGSAAMEATFANLVEPGDVVLIFVAGYFGLRMKDMAERYGADLKAVVKPWGSYFTLDEIKAALNEHNPKVVGLVHADTSTGVLQPMEGVGAAVREKGGYLILDTVTSLGGIPVRIDEWQVDAAYSGSQKCLSCPPGIAPLTLNQRAMDKVLARKNKVPNWYLDLTMVGKYWGAERTYHHTAPINMVYALRESLRLVAEEGLEARWVRHQNTAALMWSSLKEIGLDINVEEEDRRLVSLIAVRVPNGVDAKAVCKFVLEKYNLEIGGGLGELAGKIWRIGLMGFNSRAENVLLCVNALKDALKNVK
jgi:alanine-glyoxylate transaminase/serine-glyoxylate transaminase/serine-pyruvate transaminase